MAKMIEVSDDNELSHAWDFHINSNDSAQVLTKLVGMLDYLKRGVITGINVRMIDCNQCTGDTDSTDRVCD